MTKNFTKDYPDFASIERHIRRAHAERAIAIAAWIAEAIVGTTRTVRGLFQRTPARRNARLVVRASVPR